MHTHASLVNDLKSIGLNSSDAVMVHSSMKAIGEVQGGADTVIDALIDVLGDGLLMFPTHTWQEWNNKDGVFDPSIEPSCVGILPEIFRKRAGVHRSLHPTHSIAALGPQAAAYVKDEEKTKTPCPREGCWGRLFDIGAKILFLGASLKRNTFLHSVEEWHDIPDRLSEVPTMFWVVTSNGKVECPQFRHHSSLGDVSEHFDKIEPLLLKKGIARQGKVGNARSILCEVRPMAALTGHLLEDNPSLFNDAKPLEVG